MSLTQTCYWHKIMNWCLDHLGIKVHVQGIQYVKKENITFAVEKILCLWFLVRLNFPHQLATIEFTVCSMVC